MNRIKPSELAKKYGVHRATVYEWIKRGLIPEPRRTPSGQMYWKEEDLVALEEQQ